MLFTYRNLVVGISLLVGSSGALLGCGDAEPLGPGALDVSWKVSPRSCEESGVEQVNIKLTKDEVSTDHLFPCAAKQALIEDIEAAKYSLSALGLDEDGRSIFVAESTSVTVKADSTKVVDELVLTAKPAELEVNGNSMTARCATRLASVRSIFRSLTSLILGSPMRPLLAIQPCIFLRV